MNPFPSTSCADRVSERDGLTVGFEVESHILSPTSLVEDGDIAARVIANGDAVEEFHRSVIELRTDVFSPDQLREALATLKLQELTATSKSGGHSMHYSVSVDGQGEFRVADNPRYAYNDHTDTPMTRYAINSGIHVHVGVADPDVRVEVKNRLMAFEHVLVALTATSPINEGFRRCFGSYRVNDFGAKASVFDVKPNSYNEYLDMVCEALATINKTDVTALHPWIRAVLDYNPMTGEAVNKPQTVEVRLFDNALTVDDQRFATYLSIGLVNAILDDIANDVPERTYMNVSLVRSARQRAAMQGMLRPLRDPFVKVGQNHQEGGTKPAWEVAESVFNEVRRGLSAVERRMNLVEGVLVQDFNTLAAAIRSMGTGSQRLLAAHDAIHASLKKSGVEVPDIDDWYAGHAPMSHDTARSLKAWLLFQNHFGCIVPGSDVRDRRALARVRAEANAGEIDLRMVESIQFYQDSDEVPELDELRQALFGTWRQDLFHSGVHESSPAAFPRPFQPVVTNEQSPPQAS